MTQTPNHYRWRKAAGGAFVLVREFADSNGEVREDEILKAKPLNAAGRAVMEEFERRENFKAALRVKELANRRLAG